MQADDARRPNPQGDSADNADENLRAQGQTDQSIRWRALTPGYERDLLYEEHPIVTNSARIRTPPLREAYDVVAQTVVHRDPGRCLIGDFRFGKSTAISTIIEEMQSTFPSLPIGRVIAKGHDASTEKAFYTDILTDFNLLPAMSGTAGERRARVLTTVVTQARQRKSNRYLLFVDEGQNWGESEYTFLRDLTNDWHDNLQVAVITVIFAHPSVNETRNRLLSRGRKDLIGRFLLDPIDFRGIHNIDELRDVLKAHDDPGRHEFPVHSGICYSEFFLPAAWQGGWRFEHELNDMWSAFCQVAGRSQRPAENIGMNWISGAIRNFFFSSAQLDCSGLTVAPTAWVDAVEASGYASSLF